MATAQRPVPTKRGSQLPGSFDLDEDPSPIKTVFDDDSLAALEGPAERSFDPSEVDPKSVSKEDSSAMESDNDTFLQEKEMRRRLDEFDSTFLGESSPGVDRHAAAAPDLSGITEESLEGGALTTATRESEDDAQDSSKTEKDSSTSSGNHHTPANDCTEASSPAPEETPIADDRINTSALEHMSSSPAAAAAARTVSRIVSTTSNATENLNESRGGVSVDQDETPHQRGSSTPPGGSPTPTKVARTSPDKASPISRRPAYLQSRMASGRASYSSNATVSTDGGSDVTLAADFALQSGGAVPERGSLTSRPTDFARTISLGSVASGISASEEPRIGDSLLPTLEEDPKTPFLGGRKVSDPSDTVINRHVEKISVPETVARQYRSSQRDLSPDKRNGAGRKVGNLTLKEQSNTVDRLMKENWNLKLKITFLDEALNRKSDESIKAMINENVDLRTAKFQSAKETRELKRSIRDLEKRLREKSEELSQKLSMPTPEPDSGHDEEAWAEMEDEVTYLRERVTTYEVDLEKYRHEAFVQETEKKKLAEVVRQISTSNQPTDIGAREEVDLWKDLLDAETARREQADEDNRRLREEINRLRSDASSTTTNNYAANVFNVRKRNKQASVLSYGTGSDRGYEHQGPGSTASSTLVEQLRHENAELRREVGAQTSMLTSRNRERERLQQEIEDLKLGSRRLDSRSVTGDSIFERSASRAHGRPGSRASGSMTQLSDGDREILENKCSQLRDQNNKLRIEIQSLASQADKLLDELEHTDTLKDDHEKLKELYDSDIALATEDLNAMQKERDEALQLQEDLEADLQEMKAEGSEKIGALEDELEQRAQDIEHMQNEVANREEVSESLRTEVHKLSENIVRIEDEMESKLTRIRGLELELEEVSQEADTMDKDVREEREKSNKLTVQNESASNEINFLREEQETDKIKIGDLEDALNDLQTSLKSEKERVGDLENQIAEERQQREVIGSKEKQEVQKMTNELNREISTAKDEGRKLRKNLEARSNEATSFKERLTELENHLKEVLGDPSGNRSTFLVSITKLQKDLHSTSTELDSARQSLSEKEQMLKHRDELLESHSLESKRLAEHLERERQGRRADKAQHEQWQRSNQHTSRTVTQKDTRITELESSRQADRKRISSLETHYKELLSDRNSLLINLWTRVSSICGSEWQHQNSLINNRLPTVDAISNANMYTPFSRNIVAAVKQIESVIVAFQTKIKIVERSLWTEYESIEQTLDARTRKLDKLEATVQSHRVSGAFTAAPEIAKLRGENRLLKSDLANLQKQLHARNAAARSGSPRYEKHPSTFPGGGGGAPPEGKDLAAPAPSLARHHSSSAVEHLTHTMPNSPTSPSTRRSSKNVIQIPPPPPPQSSGADSIAPSGGGEPNQQRWIHRLRELERRLKAEREARLLDRSGARKRLEEGAEENRRLKGELERERVRKGMGGGEGVAGGSSGDDGTGRGVAENGE